MKNKRFPLFFMLLIIVGCQYLKSCKEPVAFTGTTVSVEVQQTETPIQKYVYGQFIEHLGQCIYQGIWAEMLLDRKFYFPVTDEYAPWAMANESFWADSSTLKYPYLGQSPWQVIGPAGSVSMDKQTSYVGEQTPVIALNGQRGGD